MLDKPYCVTFVSSLFHPDGVDREASNETLGVLLEALVKVDVIEMRVKRLPDLYTSGVRYEAEPAGQENWQDAFQLMHKKRGDCEDLAAYRAAELRVKHNIPARAIFIFAQRGRLQLYHCRVRYPAPPAGSASFVAPSAVMVGAEYEEDPSVVLGMRNH